jgi:hypothetical protein
MVSCPNCKEKSRNTFEYCRFCGSRLSGENPGNHKTDMLNVFRDGDEYIYLFTVRGNQEILRAGSLEELADMVHDKQYPWLFNDWKDSINTVKRQTLPVPEVSTEFLKASALKEVEIIPTSSTKRKKDDDESYTPDYEVSRVV